MSGSDDGSRPISVAELLARNGSVGAPSSTSGHRRRRRRKGDAVSVAELTSEIPVVRDEVPAAEAVDAAAEEAVQEGAEETTAEAATEAAGEGAEETTAEAATEAAGEGAEETVQQAAAEAAEEDVAEGVAEAAGEGVAEAAGEDAAEVAEETVAESEQVAEEVAEEDAAEEEAAEAADKEVADKEVDEQVAKEVLVEEVAAEEVPEEVAAEIADVGVDSVAEEAAAAQAPAPPPTPAPPPPPAPTPPPPRSGDPLPSRRRGPERSYDPRPVRRASGAEQMAYDPVDQSVDLAELVDEHAAGAEELQSYLRASGGALFSGETVADDRARRGLDTLDTDVVEPVADTAAPRRPRGALRLLWSSFVAVLQSLLAVAFGAGLFIAFGQLWQWNSIVALALSVLVILGLVVAVRVVRRTEDIASTLIAVAVGALVTLGPLALMQSI